ncbi:dihydroxyacetone kinase DhaL subunit [Motilibacter rhizosphaerae]|uniref:Dihydroxyacetone kinase DhaL subunit n=1 Tax=Motilibacter rhizosphaerae TaxID=598652 RepID=A0A4Q7NRI0_9ACTN|nr:dihydroxyacetone kinase subunit DhaL [Motilibacter rhizosphaerae]RZS89368.1 dihydroxyacetone kinase DhaL subunit [Motilibacter rhizosphaerae]
MRTTADVVEGVRRYAAVVQEQRQRLIDLDAAIGDADHGENMARGLAACVEQLATEPPASPSAALKSVATTLMRKVGGASGPLYGTAFLRASTAVGDKDELEPADVAAALTAARDGIVARGKAEPGDKTMVDAWTPAVEAAGAALEAGGDTAQVLRAAADAALAGAEATVPLVARKGRASYLGERSAGHQDPGATSTALLLAVLAAVAEERTAAAAG